MAILTLDVQCANIQATVQYEKIFSTSSGQECLPPAPHLLQLCTLLVLTQPSAQLPSQGMKWDKENKGEEEALILI